MIGMAFDLWPAWAVIPGLAAHVALGAGLGILHFRGLWRSVRLLAGHRRAAALILGMAGRFALTGAVLALASLEGAWPLLATAVGLFAARAVVVRRVRRVGP